MIKFERSMYAICKCILFSGTHTTFVCDNEKEAQQAYQKIINIIGDNCPIQTDDNNYKVEFNNKSSICFTCKKEEPKFIRGQRVKIIDWSDLSCGLREEELNDILRTFRNYECDGIKPNNGDLFEFKTHDNKTYFMFYMDKSLYQNQSNHVVAKVNGLESQAVAIIRPACLRNSFECFSYGDYYNCDYSKYGKFDRIELTDKDRLDLVKYMISI